MSHALNYLFADGQLKQGTLRRSTPVPLLTAEDNPEVRAADSGGGILNMPMASAWCLRKNSAGAGFFVAGADLWEAR